MARFKEVPAVVEPPPSTYVLELTREEAVVLRKLLGNCIWNGPTQSMRDAVNSVIKHCETSSYECDVSQYGTFIIRKK